MFAREHTSSWDVPPAFYRGEHILGDGGLQAAGVWWRSSSYAVACMEWFWLLQHIGSQGTLVGTCLTYDHTAHWQPGLHGGHMTHA